MVWSIVKAKHLIRLVRERPALWDKTSENYKDRISKTTSWREICTYINKNYNSMPPSEKQIFTRTIMKKWTHIRDAWIKTMKCGYDTVTMMPAKPYVYHDEMIFMQRTLSFGPSGSDLSDMHVYKEGNETQNSYDASFETDDHVEIVNAADGDISIENLKQESIASHTDSETTIFNKTQDLENADDTHLEVTERINPRAEEKLKEAKTAKRKRKSISRSSWDNEEREVAAPPKSPLVSTVECPQINYQSRGTSLYENRHWNFFMGILPSVSGLDEDHVLEFQSGVITFLRNLRQSQKQQLISRSNCVPPGHSSLNSRKRKSSRYGEKFPVDNHISRRKATNQISDPIAHEEKTSDMEFLSDN